MHNWFSKKKNWRFCFHIFVWLCPEFRVNESKLEMAESTRALLEVEWTSKNRTSNIPNLRGSNIKHIQTSHLGPKLNFEPLKHHQKPNCSWTLLIRNGPNFFQNHQNRILKMSEHVILAKNRTSNLPNITKNQTVREHWTVRSHSLLWARFRQSERYSPTCMEFF